MPIKIAKLEPLYVMATIMMNLWQSLVETVLNYYETDMHNHLMMQWPLNVIINSYGNVGIVISH